MKNRVGTLLISEPNGFAFTSEIQKSVFIRVYPWFNCIVANRSATGHLLQLFRIPGAMHRDLRGGAFDVTKVVRRQFDCNCSEVLVQTMQLHGAGMGTIHGFCASNHASAI